MEKPAGAPWVVNVESGRLVELEDGVVLGRDEFLGWVWGQCGDDGLTAIAEGEIDAAEAAAIGLVPSARVVDAAAAPAGRDWVGGRDVATIACWFEDEAAARRGARTMAKVRGCTVTAIREATPVAADWRSGFTTIEVPGFGAVRPAWDEGESGLHAAGTTIFIEPGIGFGTGLHETTRLCLAAMVAWADAGGRMARVLDFGSGSGILAIAAAVRGGGVVDAIEIDQSVHGAIRGNAARNGVASRLTVAADLPRVSGGYDLVVANIVADVLLQHADALCEQVRKDTAGTGVGGVILSGLVATDVATVEAVYAGRLGTAPVTTRLGDWHCLRFGSPAG